MDAFLHFPLPAVILRLQYSRNAELTWAATSSRSSMLYPIHPPMHEDSRGLAPDIDSIHNAQALLASHGDVWDGGSGMELGLVPRAPRYFHLHQGPITHVLPDASQAMESTLRLRCR